MPTRVILHPQPIPFQGASLPAQGRLLEWMLVLALIVMVTAIAVPFYLGLVRDARTAEAKGALDAIRTAELAAYQRTGSYVAVFGNESLASALGVELGKAGRNWSFSVVASGANGYTVDATGIGPEVSNPALRVRMIYDPKATPRLKLVDVN